MQAILIEMTKMRAMHHTIDAVNKWNEIFPQLSVERIMVGSYKWWNDTKRNCSSFMKRKKKISKQNGCKHIVIRANGGFL